MGEKIPYKARKPGGGRKKRKPEYDAGKRLKEQLDVAVVLYNSEMSLQTIADALSLNPIKVRKLLITAGVYESDTAKLVQRTFNTFRETQSYSAAVTSTMAALRLSRPSVTSYLPYEKGVYFPEEAEATNISAGAERQRHYRAVSALKKNPCEENLWKCVVAFRGYKFKTMSSCRVLAATAANCSCHCLFTRFMTDRYRLIGASGSDTVEIPLKRFFRYVLRRSVT